MFSRLIFFICNLLLCIPLQSLAQTAPDVVVFKVQTEDWSDRIEALGTLRANETVVLTASVTDTITSIHFDDGQRVEKGAVLVEMTDEEESALVAEMTARLSEAKRQLDRLKALPNSGAVSESLYDQREREFEAANAQLAAMKSRLKDRLIIAPFDGVVGLRNISAGALVEPGDEITTLTDDSIMKLDFSVPALFLPSLKKGLPIVAHTEAYPERSFKGEVSGIDSRVDPVTRAISVRALLSNEEKLLKPGLLMNVELHYSPRTALVVPEEALIPSGSSNAVFVVDETSKVVERREVSIGSRRKGEVEVVSGVSEGELVITHGTMAARPESPVQILAYQKQGEGIQDILKRVGEQ